MKKLIILLLLAVASNAFSQDWPFSKMEMNAKIYEGNIELPGIKSFSPGAVVPGKIEVGMTQKAKR
jgi:hypothetical protein